MKNLDAILSAQVRSWDAARRKAAERGGLASAPLPVITISRQHGADGEAIARLVGSELGLELWDHEIVHAIAEKSGMPEVMFETLDEHARTQLQEFIGALFSSDKEAFAYARELSRVIVTVAHHGAAVLVGHGAEFVVPRDRALRVRIVSPLASRARAQAAARGIDLLEAEDEVLAKDRQERAFCRQYFGIDSLDAEHYDLVVNRKQLSVEATARIIAAAYDARFPGRRAARS